MLRKSFATVALASTALAFTQVARAQSTPSDKALAESLFREARLLVESKRLEEACPKFAESHRIEPKLGTLLHLATCHEQTGKTASAWAEFGEAAALAARARETAREKLANERVRALEPKLARIRIVFAEGAKDVELALDGKPLGAASTSVPLPVDAGVHVLTAAARDRKPARIEIKAVDGTTSDITVPVLEAEKVAAVVEPQPTPKPLPPPPAESRGVATGTWILGGVAVAGIAVGSAFGVRFLSQRSDGLSECEAGACTQHGLDQLDAARTSSLVSGIGFGVGLAAAVGAVVVQLSSRPAPANATALHLGPGGVRLRGAW